MKKIFVLQEQLDTNKINPHILYTHLFMAKNRPRTLKLLGRYVFDYEIEYFLYNGGSMWINDKLFTIKRGDIIFRRPGDWTQAIKPYYDCYGVFFDLSCSKPSYPDIYAIHKTDNIFQSYYKNEILDIIPHQVHTNSSTIYLELFENILKEFINSSKCSDLLIKSYILKILTQTYMEVKNPFSLNNSKTIYKNSLLEDVIKYIHNNIDSNLNLNTLAKISHLSPNYFHYLFTKTMNITPNEYIVKLRIAKSKELLLRTKLSISEIATVCGFDSLSYFSYIFKKNSGIPPNQYRKNMSW